MHSDFIEFEPLTMALPSAEKVEAGKRRVEECLVVFASVEKADEGDKEAVASRAADEIASVASKIKASKIVLYPWVHLSSSPSGPSFALETLKAVEERAKEKGLDVQRAPFGWYKSFQVKCKGHPLSELSREIRAQGAPEAGRQAAPVAERQAPAQAAQAQCGPQKPGEAVSDSLKKEAEMKSSFFVLTLEGELVEPEKFKFTKLDENLRKFFDYETRKVRAYEKEPPHIRLMKDHKIADYEPGSDSGNFRWYPKGRLVKKLLERHISQYCGDYGAMEVETPVMYDYEHPALKKYLNRFPARQYVVKSDEKNFFLRFSACFGQFLMAHDMVISYKDLPVKMYELTRYSFRREQSGELAGLKRVRAMTMPDMHTICADLAMAKEEFGRQYGKALEWISLFGLEYEVGFRVQKDFFEENRDWYVGMAKRFGKPILLELFDVRYAYFITKFEFNFVDALSKASALSTVQIDVENAETYDISFVDSGGEKKRPAILHASLSGSLERVVYALLEQQAIKMARGETAMFPLWLSPTQVRVIPVSGDYNAFACEVAEQFELSGIRADVDDRDDTLQKRIREAEKEWVPFILVVGEKEKSAKSFTVRVRGKKEQQNATIEELIVAIRKKTELFPFEKLPLPRLLSRRPVFSG
jgi:threonyl-tRNA synthetase